MNKGGLRGLPHLQVFPQKGLAAGAGQEGWQQSADSMGLPQLQGVHLPLI